MVKILIKIKNHTSKSLPRILWKWMYLISVDWVILDQIRRIRYVKTRVDWNLLSSKTENPKQKISANNMIWPESDLGSFIGNQLVEIGIN